MENWNNSNRWEYCQEKENPGAGKENPTTCGFKNSYHHNLLIDSKIDSKNVDHCAQMI